MSKKAQHCCTFSHWFKKDFIVFIISLAATLNLRVRLAVFQVELYVGPPCGYYGIDYTNGSVFALTQYGTRFQGGLLALYYLFLGTSIAETE